MTDRELLEAAARAAGMDGYVYDDEQFGMRSPPICTSYGPCNSYWNPLDDDGDALRLAVALGLGVDCSRPSAGEPFHFGWCEEKGATDPYAATRRAIVRAAAAMGKEGR